MITILSNLDIRCGNAEQGRDIMRELSACWPVRMVPDPRQIDSDCKLVFINWHPYRVSLSVELMRELKARNLKVIVEIQNSTGDLLDVPENSTLDLADAIIAHEPTACNRKKVEFIPVGIPVYEGLPPVGTPSVGVAGFPFAWKRFDVVAEVARRFGIMCRMIAPNSDIQDRSAFVKGVREHLGPLADVHTEWMSNEEVVRLLATCTFTVFWFSNETPADQLGQSGSVRMGVGSRRPMILSTHRKFRTLMPYADKEFYVAQEEAEVYSLAELILASPDTAKKPDWVLAEQGWPFIGERYRKLVREILEQ